MSKVKISESKLRKIIKEEYEKIEKDVDLEEEELNELFGRKDWAKEADKINSEAVQKELESYKKYSNEMNSAMKEMGKFLEDIRVFLARGTQTSNLKTQQSAFQPKPLGGALEEQDLENPSSNKSFGGVTPKDLEHVRLKQEYNNQRKILETAFKAMRQVYSRMEQIQKKFLPQAEKAISTGAVPAFSPAFKSSRAQNKPAKSPMIAESIDKLIDEEIEKLLKENKR